MHSVCVHIIISMHIFPIHTIQTGCMVFRLTLLPHSEKIPGSRLGIVFVEYACSPLECVFFHSPGKAMALMVAQARARWLNLSSLSQKKKTQLLNVPMDLKGLFGPATLQECCKKKRRQDEALQLCLPRKVPPHPPLHPVRHFSKLWHA